MLPRVQSVTAREDYSLLIRFTDGTFGTVSLATDIARGRGRFGDLRVPEYFCRVRVDHDAGTVVWPNGLDLDPDQLYHEATGQPLPLSDGPISNAS